MLTKKIQKRAQDLGVVLANRDFSNASLDHPSKASTSTGSWKVERHILPMGFIQGCSLRSRCDTNDIR
jgi:hypothetical protein